MMIGYARVSTDDRDAVGLVAEAVPDQFGERGNRLRPRLLREEVILKRNGDMLDRVHDVPLAPRPLLGPGAPAASEVPVAKSARNSDAGDTPVMRSRSRARVQAT